MRTTRKQLILALLPSLVLFNLTSYAQKAELAVQTGHTGKAIFVEFSPDGKYLASSDYLMVTKLWDVATGRELRTIAGGGGVFSPDGKTLATIGMGLKLWDWRTGQLLHTLHLQVSQSTNRVAFSPKGDVVASIDALANTIRLWDVKTGRTLRTLAGHTGLIGSVAFSPDGKTLVSDSADRTIKLWDWQTGEQLRTIRAWTGSISFTRPLAFSPDGATLAGSVLTEEVTLWDVATGQPLREIRGAKAIPATSLSFSSNGKALAAIDNGMYGIGTTSTIKLFDSQTGQELRKIEFKEQIQWFEFSPDDKLLAVIGADNNPRLFDATTGKELRALAGYAAQVTAVGASADGSLLAGGCADGSVRLWDVRMARQVRTLKGQDANVSEAAAMRGRGLSEQDASVRRVVFSQDGKTLASSTEQVIKLWDVATGRELKSLRIDDPATQRQVEATVPAFYTGASYEAPAGAKFKLYPGQNGKLDVAEGERLALSLLSLNEDDWVAVTPEGLFDASPGARRLMHYVAGLEPVRLEQMKDVYYVPGLLRKVFGGEPLPQVELFAAQDLFPSVEFEPLKPNQTQLTVILTNRGGGIGQVQVLFNGKELTTDARPTGLPPNAANATISVDLSKAAVRVGEENRVEVVARNAAGSLSTRGTRGAEFVYTDPGRRQSELPNIYAIVGGISDYTGDSLKLNFAAKDAEDFARALELGAIKLLNGDKSKVHIRLLTGSRGKPSVEFSAADAKISAATKADFSRAFADFRGAAPGDVFIVYLAGHGISLNLNQNPAQVGGNTYLYLTQEATTTDKSLLAVESSRRAMAISSEELKDLMKQNKALKQVLVLDTCAAGVLSNSLVGRRDLPGDQIRAIERLKDSTGFFVLMGAAADAVSYEASQYGQGLLTYSLLQGMKGARLRENQFADVGMLFGYAQDTVPSLAKNVGGLQRPLIITPETSKSFDIGRFTAEEQKQIALSQPKPLILRPTLLNSKLKRDDQNLTQLLQQHLREASHSGAARGNAAPFVFIEADEMADAIAPSGLYAVEGNTLSVNVILYRNKEQVSKEISVTSKADDKVSLVRQLIAEIIKATK